MARLRALAGTIGVLAAGLAVVVGAIVEHPSTAAVNVVPVLTWTPEPPTSAGSGTSFALQVTSTDPTKPPVVTAVGDCTVTGATGPITVRLTAGLDRRGLCTLTATADPLLCGGNIPNPTTTTKPSRPTTTKPSLPPSSPLPSPPSSPPSSIITSRPTTPTTKPSSVTTTTGPGTNPIDAVCADVRPIIVTAGSIDYVPVMPVRVLETRDAARSHRDIKQINYALPIKPQGVVSGNNVIRVQVAGKTYHPIADDSSVVFTVPADAVAVALNLAGVDADTPGWLRAWDCSAPSPNVSNVNLAQLDPATNAPADMDGDARANLVITGMSAAGEVCFVTLTPADMFADLIGYFPKGSPYRPLAPKRVVETRREFSEYNAVPLTPGQRRELPLEAWAATVTTGSAYVALNVTSTVDPNAPVKARGTVTVFDCDAATPPPGSQTVLVQPDVVATPLLVVAKVNPAKSICVVSTVDTHLVVDLFGEFGGNTRFRAFASVPVFSGAFGEQDLHQIQISGTSGFAGAAVDAAFLKITSSGGTINGFITVYPCRTGSRPGTSSLNVAQFGPKGNPFPDAANVVFAQTDDLGRICVFTQHRAQLQIEAFGYWPRVP